MEGGNVPFTDASLGQDGVDPSGEARVVVGREIRGRGFLAVVP